MRAILMSRGRAIVRLALVIAVLLLVITIVKSRAACAAAKSGARNAYARGSSAWAQSLSTLNAHDLIEEDHGLREDPGKFVFAHASSLVVSWLLFCWKVSSPLLVAAKAVTGLVAFRSFDRYWNW